MSRAPAPPTASPLVFAVEQPSDGLFLLHFRRPLPYLPFRRPDLSKLTSDAIALHLALGAVPGVVRAWTRGDAPAPGCVLAVEYLSPCRVDDVAPRTAGAVADVLTGRPAAEEIDLTYFQ
jgi:hypothetical protein